ncbi:MAG: PilZ domain-containing protein [Nitrospira sp.]|nr:PilZ domain-containing protein [Nitrospira sp.]
MKTYAVRKALRSSIHSQFCYFGNGTLTNGTIWDLSETGWRATGEYPLPAGTETTVSITLHDGKTSLNILIDGAIVRWSRGLDMGWEITRMDEENRARLMDFFNQFEPTAPIKDTTDEIHWY